jgi:hypothetical protein
MCSIDSFSLRFPRFVSAALSLHCALFLPLFLDLFPQLDSCFFLLAPPISFWNVRIGVEGVG